MTNKGSYADILNGVNTAYHRGNCLSELDTAARDLDALLKKSDLSESNRESAEALSLRLTAKRLYLRYISELSDGAYRAIAEHTESGLARAREKGWKKTQECLEGLEKLLKSCEKFRAEVLEISAVIDGTTDWEECFRAKAQALKLANGAESAIAFKNPFGDNVACPTASDELKSLAMRAAAAADTAKLNLLRDAYAGTYVDVGALTDMPYFPEQEYDEGGKAPAMVVCTPFAGDFRLFAVRAGRGKVYEIAAEVLESNNAKFTDGFFALCLCAGADAAVSGCEQLTPYKLARVLKRAMLAGRAGIKAFLQDGCGDGQVYCDGLKTAEEIKELTALDISRTYLSVPPFADTAEELCRLGALKESDRERLKAAPFMGFAGLNSAVKAYFSGRDFISEAEKISKNNEKIAKKYLKNIKNSYLFLDSGWGDYSQDTARGDETGAFSYDGLEGRDIQNVREIMEKDITVFAKCGALARYCTLGCADSSEWEYLDMAEMQRRVEAATELVFRALRVDVKPQVEVLENIRNVTAGATCYDGGKRVVYKYSSAKNINWLLGAIVHESFHAMQAKLTGGGWSRWYLENLCITRGRVEQWRLTMQEKYDGDTRSKVYKVHMYEADARAFETDCDDGRTETWNTFDFR